jgi:hypothetical protein
VILDWTILKALNLLFWKCYSTHLHTPEISYPCSLFSISFMYKKYNFVCIWMRSELKSTGFWWWCVIICNSILLGIVRVYILIKLLRFGSWIFLRLQVKRGRTETPGWASLRPANQGAQQLGFLSSPFLPEDGRWSSFRNVVILLKYRRWTMPKKTLLQRSDLLNVLLLLLTLGYHVSKYKMSHP